MQIVEEIRSEALAEVEKTLNRQDLDQIRVQYLGKKGKLTAIMKELGKLPKEEKPKLGQAVNVAKDDLQSAINARLEAIDAKELSERLAKEKSILPCRGLDKFKDIFIL